MAKLLLTTFFIILSHAAFANKSNTHLSANCTIVYSLTPSSDKDFIAEVSTLSYQLSRQNVTLIDLNSRRNHSLHKVVSGRQKKLLREKLDIPKYTNQVVVLDRNGRIIKRYTGSVTLVSPLLDCKI